MKEDKEGGSIGKGSTALRGGSQPHFQGVHKVGIVVGSFSFSSKLTTSLHLKGTLLHYMGMADSFLACPSFMDRKEKKKKKRNFSKVG